MQTAEVAIIGGGPIGIELAVALKRRGISYLHFEAKQIGQTMFWWPPGTRWFSSNERIAIAGVPLATIDQGKATREDYLRYLRCVVEEFDLTINTYEPVVGIEQAKDEGGRMKEEGGRMGRFVVRTAPQAGPREHRVNNIVLATGGTAAPRRLDIPGEDLPHVSHYMEDPHKYFRRRVLVVGGKNSAVEAALRIQQVGAEVTISYRQAEFNARSIKYWLYPEIMGLIRAGRIRAHFNTVVRQVTREDAELARCGEGGLFASGTSSFRVPVDFVLLLTGYIADMTLAKLAGVELRGENQAPVFDPMTMQTNVPGVYIAGTVIAGTQDRYRVFLENCHGHVERIIASLTGEAPPPERQLPAVAEV